MSTERTERRWSLSIHLLSGSPFEAGRGQGDNPDQSFGNTVKLKANSER